MKKDRIKNACEINTNQLEHSYIDTVEIVASFYTQCSCLLFETHKYFTVYIHVFVYTIIPAKQCSSAFNGAICMHIFCIYRMLFIFSGNCRSGIQLTRARRAHNTNEKRWKTILTFFRFWARCQRYCHHLERQTRSRPDTSNVAILTV